MNTEIVLPQPDEISYKERERGLASYFMMFISSTVGLPIPFINLIASWIYYHYTRRTSRFVKFHSLQSLLSQLPVTVLNTSLVVWFISILVTNIGALKDELFASSFLGFLATVIAVNLVYIIFSIIAAVRAYQGRLYYFPYFGNVAYKYAFLQDDEFTPRTHINKAPKL